MAEEEALFHGAVSERSTDDHARSFDTNFELVRLSIPPIVVEAEHITLVKGPDRTSNRTDRWHIQSAVAEIHQAGPSCRGDDRDHGCAGIRACLLQ